MIKRNPSAARLVVESRPLLDAKRYAVALGYGANACVTRLAVMLDKFGTPKEFFVDAITSDRASRAEEFQAIRQKVGLSREMFGRALGYTGALRSVAAIVFRYESGEREIPEPVFRLAIMIGKHGTDSLE